MNVIHALDSRFGERHMYGARSRYIAEATRPADALDVYAAGSAVSTRPSLSYRQHLVRPTALHRGYRRLIALFRPGTPPRAQWKQFDRRLSRFLDTDAAAHIDIVHTWTWIPQTISVIRRRFPKAKIIRDVVIARRIDPHHKTDLVTEAQEFDILISPSDYASEALLSWGIPESKIATIPFGVDVEAFAPHPNKAELPLRFAFSGNLNGRKGARPLLAAWEKLAFSDSELHLYGRIRNAFREPVEANPSIVGHGFVDLTQHLADNHVFVFPSKNEGSAKAVYEALACGLPVITTHNAGSVVRDGVEGFIVPADDVAALVDRMRLLHHDPALRSRMAKAARKRALEFTWKQYAQNVWNLYSRLAKNTDGQPHD